MNPLQSQQIIPQQMLGIQNPFGTQGAPDLMLLRQLSQGFSPTMSAAPPTLRTGFENLPGFNQPGLSGMMMQMFVAPQLSKMMGSIGMMPGGLGSQNILDMLDAQRFQQQQQQILGAVSGQDQAGFLRTIQGIQALTGAPMGPDQRAAAQRLASTAASLGSTFAPMAPEMVDMLAGPTGSASVMAMRMQQFNRFRTDPVTGQMGFTPESNIQMAEQLFEEMFAPENIAGMRGMRAGQVGSLFNELGRRGMLRGTNRAEALNQSVQSILSDPTHEDFLEVSGITTVDGPGGEVSVSPAMLDTNQLDRLRSIEGVQSGMREFDASNVQRSLEGYVDVITSMREIFGDAGVTNAPIQELIAGLEALSQGTVTQVDPGMLNMMVRTTQQLARQSGMSIDAMAMMQQQGAGTLQNMGVNRAFAPSITQGAVAFGMATGDAGVFSNPVFGLENAEFHRQMDQNLRASATASPVNRAFGALLNAEEVGFGVEGEDGFDPHAAALATAIRNGQTQYTFRDSDGNMQTRHTGADASMIETMLVRQGQNQLGLTESEARVRARQRMSADQENLRASFESGANNLVTRFRSDEFEDFFTGHLAGVFGNEDGQGEARQRAFMQAFTRMDPTNMSREGRNQQLFEALRGDANFDNITDAQLRDMINTGYGELDDAIGDSPFSAIGGAANAQVQYNRTLVEEAGFQQRLAQVEGSIRDSMTGLTGDNMLSGAIRAFQEAGQEEGAADLTQFLGTTFGGVRADEISKRLSPAMQQFTAAQQRVEEIQQQLANTQDPAERRRLLGQLSEERDTLRAEADSLRTLAEQHGMFSVEDAVDMTDVNAVEDAQQANFQNRLTSAGLTLPERGAKVGTLEQQLKSFGIDRSGDNALTELSDSEAVALEDALVNERFGITDKTKQEERDRILGGKNVADFRESFRAGTLGQRGKPTALTDSEQRRVLDANKDSINISPTEAEINAAMEGDGLDEKQRRDPQIRREYERALSSENRIKKTGLLPEEFGFRAEQELEREEELRALGLNEAVVQRMINADREEAFMTEGAVQAVSTQAGRQALKAAFSSMSKEDRATLNRGAKRERAAVQSIISQGRGEDFITRAGGQGQITLDELQELQDEELQLVRLFDNDFGAMTAGAIGDDAASHRRLLAFANVNADTMRKFAEAEGQKFDELDDSAKVNLTAQYAQQRSAEISKSRVEATRKLGAQASRPEMYAGSDRGNVEALLRERGLPAEEEDIARILNGEGDPDILRLAKAATTLQGGIDEAKTPEEFAKFLHERPELAAQRAELLTGRRAAADREKRLRDTGGRTGLAALAQTAGLEGQQERQFIMQNQGLVTTDEGAAWAKELASSVGLVKDKLGVGNIDVLERALKTGDVSELTSLKGIGRDDISEIMNAGRVLKEGGALGSLEDGQLSVKELTEALKALTESQKEVKDVKRQTMDITGVLKIEGNTATLAGARGMNTSGIT